MITCLAFWLLCLIFKLQTNNLFLHRNWINHVDSIKAGALVPTTRENLRGWSSNVTLVASLFYYFYFVLFTWSHKWRAFQRTTSRWLLGQSRWNGFMGNVTFRRWALSYIDWYNSSRLSEVLVAPRWVKAIWSHLLRRCCRMVPLCSGTPINCQTVNREHEPSLRWP